MGDLLYREVVMAAKDFLDKIEERLSDSNKEKFAWHQINTALTMTGNNPRQIAEFLKTLIKVKKEKLTVNGD